MSLKVLILLTLSSLSLSTLAGVNVIYGDDDRLDPVNSPSAMHRRLARSTAAMIETVNLKTLNSEQYHFEGQYDWKSLNLCADERFYSQPQASSCSGFLVAKNILVTAGHCVSSRSAIRKNVWVFDYEAKYEDQREVIVDKKNIYKMKRIISHSDSPQYGDYAVIELEREVQDRSPLKYRKSGRASTGDDIFVIGYPSGLPVKIASGAKVKRTSFLTFQANLDTYHGNSGSAVFNASTGLVEGILVNGNTDYKQAKDKSCKISNTLTDFEKENEGVTFIGIVRGL